MTDADKGANVLSGAQHVHIDEGVTINAIGRDAITVHKYNYFSSEKDIRDVLKPVDRNSHSPAKCMDGTRVNILKEINEWINDIENQKNIMFITGDPGSGKSAVASSVVTSLKEMKPERLGGYYFFKRNDNILSKCTGVWRTIVADLISQSRYASLKDKVAEQLDNTFQLADIAQHFKDLIQGPLNACSERLKSSPPVFVIDAIDECKSYTYEKIFKKTLEQWPSIPLHFKLIVTGRPIYDTNSIFNSMEKCKKISLDTDSTEITKDIYTFLKQNFKDHNDELQLSINESDLQKMTDRSKGLFIWATTAFGYIKTTDEQTDQSSPRKRLQEVLSGQIGSDLNNLYNQIIDSSFAKWNNSRKKIVGQVLATIYLKKNILSKEDLPHFLEIDDKENIMEEVKRIIHQLVPVISTDNYDIKFRHYSFVEFLTKEDKIYETSYKEHVERIARATFHNLFSGLKFNICNIKSSYIMNKEIGNLQQLISQCVPLHLQYCCKNWHLHLIEIVESNISSEKIMEELNIFLYEKFLYWLEVMSLLNVMQDVPRILKAVKNKSVKNDNAANFITDCISFVENFYIPISRSIAHIYLSALAFAPEHSLILEKNQEFYPNILTITEGREPTWNTSSHITYHHDTVVLSVACSPDNVQVVFGSQHKAVKVWNTNSEKTIAATFEGHQDEVMSVAFSPDKKSVVSGSKDKTIIVWNVENGRAITNPLQGHSDWVSSVAFSPDGKYVASGSYDKTIMVWDIETQRRAYTAFEGHSDYVTSVSFFPNSKYLVSGSNDKTVRIWNVEDGKSLDDTKLTSREAWVTCVACSPNATCIVSGSYDGKIIIWNIKTNGHMSLEGHSESVTSVAFSPDGRYFVSGSSDATIKVWEVETGKLFNKIFKGHNDSVNSVTFSSDGKQVVSGSKDETIRVWNVNIESNAFTASTPQLISTSSGTLPGSDYITGAVQHDQNEDVNKTLSEGHTGVITSVMFNPNKPEIISSSLDHTVKHWSIDCGEIVGSPFQVNNPVISLLISPDGMHVVSATAMWIQVQKLDDQVLPPTKLYGHMNPATSMAFNSMGSQLVSCDGVTVFLWDINSEKKIANFTVTAEIEIKSVALSSNGKKIILGYNDASVKIWDVDNAAQPILLYVHKSAVHSIAFSSDDLHIVSGSEDGTVIIYDIRANQVITNSKAHKSCVTCVIFPSDGQYVFSGSKDKTIRVWSKMTGEVIGKPLEGHSGTITSLAGSPDGTQLLSGSQDKTVVLWNIQTISENSGKLHSLGGQKIFSSSHSDGWVKDKNGNILFWVPFRYRRRLCSFEIIQKFPKYKMCKLDLTWFVSGWEWTNCREEIHQSGVSAELEQSGMVSSDNLGATLVQEVTDEQKIKEITSHVVMDSDSQNVGEQVDMSEKMSSTEKSDSKNEEKKGVSKLEQSAMASSDNQQATLVYEVINEHNINKITSPVVVDSDSQSVKEQNDISEKIYIIEKSDNKNEEKKCVSKLEQSGMVSSDNPGGTLVKEVTDQPNINKLANPVVVNSDSQHVGEQIYIPEKISNTEKSDRINEKQSVSEVPRSAHFIVGKIKKHGKSGRTKQHRKKEKAVQANDSWRTTVSAQGLNINLNVQLNIGLDGKIMLQFLFLFLFVLLYFALIVLLLFHFT